MEIILRQCITESLDNHLLNNAIFLAERLFAHESSEENLYILANIYYRMGKPNQCYLLLQQHSVKSIKNKYLLSKSCYDLDKTHEAELYLSQCCSYYENTQEDIDIEIDGLEKENNNVVGDNNNSSNDSSNKASDIASVFYLMAMVYKRQNQRMKTIEYLKKCLQIYPFLWIAYEQLCNIGEFIDPNQFFSTQSLDHNFNTIYTSILSTKNKQDLVIPQPSSSSLPSSSSSITNKFPTSSAITPSSSMFNQSSFLNESSIHVTPIVSKFTKPQHQQHQHQQQTNHFQLPNSPQTTNTTSTTTNTNLDKKNNNYHQFQTPQTPYSSITPILPKKYSKISPSPIPMVMYTPDPKSFDPNTTPSPQVPNKPSIPPVVKKKPQTQSSSSSSSQPQFQNEKVPTTTTSKNNKTIEFNTPSSVSNATPLNMKLNFESSQNIANNNNKTDNNNKVLNAPKKSIIDSTSSSTTTNKNKHVQIGEIKEFIIQDDLKNFSSDEEEELDDHFADSSYYFTEEQNNIEQLNLDDIKKGTIELLQLLVTIASAFRLLCTFSCKEAIETFKQLPESQYQTGWVQTRVGKAYFEMVDYNKANEVFESARELEPYRLEGTEIYSTVLWHLKKEIELSYLAHQLVEFDRLSPQAWCVVGNCFSLQKEHESALKIFNRCIQLDPSFTYAYTLTGHEYLSNDDLDNALNSYRSAIKIDPRHYNSWYGLGLIYLRQEKYDLAEYHFRKALQINGKSSVLFCYIGMALQANHKYIEALEMLEKSLQIQPKNILAKFKKATILFTMENYTQTLQELEEFKEIAPKETPIYIIMGRVYKKIGKLDKALECLNTALDLDHKNSNYIRSIIDKLHLNDDSDNQIDLQ
eukprot:gene6234-7765_t